MVDYSNPNTPLTAPRYAWEASITIGLLRPGLNPAKDRTGIYIPPPGATVKTLRDGIRVLHARECGVPAGDVVLARCVLREA